jgi:hypothetical protein
MTYLLTIPRGFCKLPSAEPYYVCRACYDCALRMDPNGAPFAHPVESHDCELHYEGVCEDES